MHLEVAYGPDTDSFLNAHSSKWCPSAASQKMSFWIMTLQWHPRGDDKSSQKGNLCHLKGARLRSFRQFQNWSNCHRINLSIKITVQNYRRTRTKHRKDKKGLGWTRLERIEVDCIWINLKNVSPRFFQIYGMSVYTCIKLSLTRLENHSQLLCGHDFANERLLVCQFDV